MRPTAAAIALCAFVAFGGCGGDGPDRDTERVASRLCATLQEWIDRIERTSKELSDRATADPDPAARKRHFEAWADAVLAQTEQLRDEVEALDLPAPLPGLDDGVEILMETRGDVAAFPTPDPERLGFRIAQVFLAMENVFAKVRTSVERLGDTAADPELAEALVETPACRDYNDPLT